MYNASAIAAPVPVPPLAPATRTASLQESRLDCSPHGVARAPMCLD